MRKHITLLLLALTMHIVASTQVSGLDRESFGKYWQVESESPDYKVSFSGDTCEIVAPKGLTLWRKEKMKGDVTIEYDACVVDEGKKDDRLSDLNCFWMASDPRHPDDIFARAEWRNGVFLRCYSLRLYYLGYGGNYNKTTRFRRYDGDERGITDASRRPSILKEYTDDEHLLKPNHWYHIRITGRGNRVQYYIDGKLLVDYQDQQPFKEGWFGFRTTLSRTRITNFRFVQGDENQAAWIRWIGKMPSDASNQTFGIPFAKGEIKRVDRLALQTEAGETLDADIQPTARWQDGSLKWAAISAVIPAKTTALTVRQSTKRHHAKGIDIQDNSTRLTISTGKVTAFIPKQGTYLLDSLLVDNMKMCGNITPALTLQDAVAADNLHLKHLVTSLNQKTEEKAGNVRAIVKIEGCMRDGKQAELFPFIIRMYFYAGSEQVKMTHTFIYDGDQDHDFIRALGIKFHVPLREEAYNRHAAFATDGEGVWSEPVQPLTGRVNLEGVYPRQIQGLPIHIDDTDEQARFLVDNWASWDGFRLSQLTDQGFSIRKRTHADRPWIGTYTGTRAAGYAFLGDTRGGLGLWLKDFWQTYPSTIEINHAREQEAEMTIWLWSPEGEAMDLRHYDHAAHDLKASYEDVQQGMSTPYGIAHTSTICLLPTPYQGKAAIARTAQVLNEDSRLVPTPEYLHAKRAFGVWSLPDRSNPMRERVEERLDSIADFYIRAVEQYRWYGFWNYGDIMHAYDHERHQWRYDVGGYAWDNTELATPEWLWYTFLRTGSKEVWRMAEAMTRHCSETDVYHKGDFAGLGSRHNVSHWGDGAKEARISQAAFNRFYYYLTGDERTGDIMREVRDADQMLYHIDPMRLAEPRSEFPCKAPARLRIGPDWLAYAGNWMTEWERTGNKQYRDKIVTGMKSIAALPHGLFTGNKALGFDPATGIISYDGDTARLNTNHLMTIMGGFELMNELLMMVDVPAFEQAWLSHARAYQDMARKVSKNKFPVRRLTAYAAWKLSDGDLAAKAWQQLWGRIEHNKVPRYKLSTVMPPLVPSAVDEFEGMTTNDAALWSLDAIYMQEVIPLSPAP